MKISVFWSLINLFKILFSLKESLIEVGYTRKFHGLKGELKIAIQDEFLEDTAIAKVLFIGTEGNALPHFVQKIRMGSDVIVQLEEVDSREMAMLLVGKTIFLRAADIIPDEERTFELEELEYAFVRGYTMEDASLGVLGEILRVEEYPQQEMAIVAYQKREVLIPLNEALITEVLEKERILKVDLPEGLLDMGNG